VQGAAAISNYIADVQLISPLNYQQFATEGACPICALPGVLIALQERKASKEFEKERSAAEAFIRTGTIIAKKISFDEMFSLVDDHLCITMVEIDRLYPNRSQSSHFVVLYVNDGDCVWLHDPGRPPFRSQKLPKARVYAAAAEPELMAVPLGTHKFGPSHGVGVTAYPRTISVLAVSRLLRNHEADPRSGT
jgi:hypothetical protein